jgi:hypothetical protein
VSYATAKLLSADLIPWNDTPTDLTVEDDNALFRATPVDAAKALAAALAGTPATFAVVVDGNGDVFATYNFSLHFWHLPQLLIAFALTATRVDKRILNEICTARVSPLCKRYVDWYTLHYVLKENRNL